MKIINFIKLKSKKSLGITWNKRKGLVFILLISDLYFGEN